MEQKAQAAEALLARSQGQEALDNAIRAAELYMAAAARADSKQDATRLRRRCQDLITYAEQLKTTITAHPSPRNSILEGASKLHGNYFPPWDAPAESEFLLSEHEELFTDDAKFTLSPTQTLTFAGWTRPKELFNALAGQSTTKDLGTEADSAIFMGNENTCDLVQDATTDCSVVAGLSAAVNILIGKPMVLSSIIYPFDHAKGRPKFSPSGKYIVRLNFNGCHRRVVIDDRLPASSTERTLFVVDRANSRLMWPALLEKAYLKVRGGYDFPGSNSGTDLWVLTGWIPEQIFLQREDIDINEIWSRIKARHDSQDVVITIGTGVISAEEESIMGLIGEHDYAIQALDETGGTRRLLVKNPWCNSPIWKGAWSPPQTEGASLVTPHQTETDTRHKDLMQRGCLWVTLEDVAQNFESMYLNWNPKLFPNRQDLHFRWETATGHYVPSVVRNPQFSIMSPNGGLVWVLVCRHFVNDELEISRKRSDSMAAASRQLGFMSILVFDSKGKGKRVQVPDGETYRGPYVDSPQTLARLDTSAGRHYTIVLDQHELPLSSYTLTLSTFSQNPVRIQEAAEPMSHIKELTGVWDRRTAGGNAACSTYFLNPQYCISVSEATPLSILLTTDSRDIHIHVDVVWAHGKRATVVRQRDILMSSGEYRRGCVVAEVPHVDPGDYSIVCSTFEAGQAAGFALRVTSMAPVRVEPIPANAAGRLQTPLGPFHLSAGVDKLRVRLSTQWLTRASACIHTGVSPRAYAGHRSPPLPLVRLSIVCGRGPHQSTIVMSGDGEFQEVSVPLRTPEFDIEPGRAKVEGMWLLVEGIGMQDGSQVLHGEVFSDSPVHIGDWEAVDTF